MKKILGTDFGRVLSNFDCRVTVSRSSVPDPARDAEERRRARPFRGALETLRFLKGNGFPTIHIVSKISMDDVIEAKVRRWLQHYGFESVISQKRAYFCAERHEKAPICKKLGITHFIDDRLEVLSYMVGIVPHLFLFRPWAPEDKPYQHLVEEGKVIVVRSWREVRKHLSPWGSLIGVSLHLAIVDTCLLLLKR